MNKTAEAIPEAERAAFLRTLAWLCVRDGLLHERELEFLNRSGANLGMNEAQIDGAIASATKCTGVRDAVQGIESAESKNALLVQLLLLAFADEVYDNRERNALRRVCQALSVPFTRVEAWEADLARQLQQRGGAITLVDEAAESPRRWTWKRAAIVGGVAVAAVGVAAATGGLAAPMIGGAIGSAMGLSGAAATSAGLAALGGGSLAAGGFGMAGGTAAMATAFGAAGGAMAAREAALRSDPSHDADARLGLHWLGGDSAHVALAISGFLSEGSDYARDWMGLADQLPFAERFALRWRAQRREDLARGLGGPLVKVPELWLRALHGADEAGDALGAMIEARTWGMRPVSLLGFSLGARVIVRTLEYLEERGAVGHVGHIVLMGGAVSAQTPVFRRLRALGCGSVANAYCRTDAILAYAYRLPQPSDFPIGLAPVDIDGILDVDVSDLATGHLEYRAQLAPVLERVFGKIHDAEVGDLP